MQPDDQPSLLAKLRALSCAIVAILHRNKVTPPQSTMELQTLYAQRAKVHAQLNPIRLIGSGISCRDCAWFDNSTGSHLCHVTRGEGDFEPLHTHEERLSDLGGYCGPLGRLFEPARGLGNVA